MHVQLSQVRECGHGSLCTGQGTLLQWCRRENRKGKICMSAEMCMSDMIVDKCIVLREESLGMWKL